MKGVNWVLNTNIGVTFLGWVGNVVFTVFDLNSAQKLQILT